MNKIDLHTHTLVSGHAYSTLLENIKSAKEKGLEVLGTSEHAPKMPGSTHPYFFSNMRVLPTYIEGIRILKGVELNILDTEGRIDLDASDMEFLDYAIISLHPPCYDDAGLEGNTNAVLKAMDHPKVKVIGHPDDSRFPLDYDRLILKAKSKNIFIEINDSSLRPTSFRQNARENYICIFKICKMHQVPIIINSDAHYADHVGRYEEALKLAQLCDFPTSLIVNFNPSLYADMI